MFDQPQMRRRLTPEQENLKWYMLSRQRSTLAGVSPMHVPTPAPRPPRTWWQRLLGAGEARWWLDLEEGSTAERWPATFAHHNNGWPCRYGYLLDSTFIVLEEIGCRHCGRRLDWANFATGKRVACHNWQCLAVHLVAAIVRPFRRLMPKIRYQAAERSRRRFS